MVLWRHQCLDSQIYLNWKLEAKEWHSIFCFWSPHSPDLNPENVWHVLNSVSRKVLSWQAYFRRDKHVFVTTNYVFCHDKSMLVSIKLLSQQTRVCRDKYFPGNFFVATKILSRQTILSRQRFLFCFCFCRDKNHTCGSSRQWHCQRFSSVQSLCKSLPRQMSTCSENGASRQQTLKWLPVECGQICRQNQHCGSYFVHWVYRKPLSATWLITKNN